MEPSSTSTYEALDLCVRKEPSLASGGPMDTPQTRVAYFCCLPTPTEEIYSRPQSLSPEETEFQQNVNEHRRYQSTSPESFRSDSDHSSSQSSSLNQFIRTAPMNQLIADPRNGFPNQRSVVLSDLFERSNQILQQNPADIEVLRQHLKSSLRKTNNHTNQNMRRVSSTNENKTNDPSYLEKRKKNNESAKRSRDARRAKEEELAITNALLLKRTNQLEALLADSRQMIVQLQRLLFQPSESGYITIPYETYRSFTS